MSGTAYPVMRPSCDAGLQSVLSVLYYQLQNVGTCQKSESLSHPQTAQRLNL